MNILTAPTEVYCCVSFFFLLPLWIEASAERSPFDLLVLRGQGLLQQALPQDVQPVQGAGRGGGGLWRRGGCGETGEGHGGQQQRPLGGRGHRLGPVTRLQGRTIHI